MKTDNSTIPDMTDRKTPHPLVAIIPVVVLIGLLVIVISLFGSDALSGGSQMALLMGVAVCVLSKPPRRSLPSVICWRSGSILVLVRKNN